MSIDRIGIQPPAVDTNYRSVDSSTQLSDLDVLCNHCTVHDSKARIVKKVYFKYDPRNERFVCDGCRRVVGANQVKTALNLNLEEYIHYNKETPVKETIRRRQVEETYAIKSNNPVPINDPSRRPRAIAINTRMKEKENNEDDEY